MKARQSLAKLTEGKNKMTNQQIKNIYDSDINMTLVKLSRITGLTIQELKFILTCTEEEY
jgi:hypothetical protein